MCAILPVASWPGSINLVNKITMKYSTTHFLRGLVAFFFFALLWSCSNSEGSSLSAKKGKTIFKEYFQAHQNQIETVGDAKVGMGAYQNGEYEKALAIFNKVLNASPNDEIAFYKANTLIAMERYKEAIPILEQLSDKPDWIFQSQSGWFLGLAYLANGEPGKAKNAFKTHISSGQFVFKSSSSKKILSRLQ